ncbi:MAG: type I 3-dehydroquinate dehydratase [Phycisphaeraceae bacterium]|nr:MAG: type I 3-dehydroquinate dehydratase [Phycisphaeraceae bacterium]
MTRTLICVPIMVEEAHAALDDAALAKSLGADLVEFRIDRIFHGEGDDDGRATALRLAAEAPLPCIITCRSAHEGGEYEGDDASRIALYEALGTAEHPPAYLDIELSTLTRSANLRQKVRLAVDHPSQPKNLSTRLILSLHDFDARPKGLLQSLERMREESAAKVLKIAYRARSVRDNLELFELLRHRTHPTIALAMGEAGLMSRILAPKFGGFLTFASLREQTATAPGQPTITELLTTYRFRSITPTTNLYAVLGWPVAHSIGPRVHNAVFDEIAHDAVYLPLPVPEGWESFKATTLALLDDPHLHFRGASITIPHKEHLLRLASEDTSRAWTIEDSARLAGAANTLLVQPDGACRITNTDIVGITAPLEHAFGGSDALKNLPIGIIGAGGAARAALTGLIRAGADITITNRNRARAEAMVESIAQHAPTRPRINIVDLDDASRCPVRVWINCTPLGLAGTEHAEASPLSDAALDNMPADGLVFDTVYNPPETPLLKNARKRSLRTISGLTMFAHQARAQSSLWLGDTPDLTTFERITNDSFASDHAGDRIQ